LDFSAASAVVFVELPQEVALVRQAEDRAHRHGQKLSVNVYFLVAKGTSDERRCCTIASGSLQMHCQARCVGPEYLAQHRVRLLVHTLVPAYLSFTCASTILPQMPALPFKPPLRACQACSAMLSQLRHVQSPLRQQMLSPGCNASMPSQHASHSIIGSYTSMSFILPAWHTVLCTAGELTAIAHPV